MQVIVNARHTDSAEWRQWSEQRVRFALRRLQALVPLARVRLRAAGGQDKQCQIALQTDGHGVLVVQAHGPDWRSALDDALGRAVHALRKGWQRRHRPLRGRMAVPVAA